jgi:hypothetical protein
MRLYHTSDYGQHIEAIQPYGRGITWLSILTDAREGCLYGGYVFVDWDNDPNHPTGFRVRSFDNGEHWEEIENENKPITTGRIPGECYSIGQLDTILYSIDYSSSYQSIPMDRHHYDFLVGHQDGEIYSPGYDLWRSEDYGRHFSVVNAGEGDDDSLAFANHMWLARGVLDGELYLLDEFWFRVFRSTDRGRTWRMQCDLNRNEYDDDREYWWDIKAGVDTGEVVIYGYAWNFNRGIDFGGTIKFLVSRDYGQHFEEHIPFDYPPNGVKEISPAIPQLYSLSAFPNPFNSQCIIEINLGRFQAIELNVIDLTGRLVDRLAQGYFNGGSHRFIWTSPSISAGCYFLILHCQDNVSKYRLIFVK